MFEQKTFERNASHPSADQFKEDLQTADILLALKN